MGNTLTTTIQAPQVVKAGLWDERMTKLAAMRVVAYQTYVKSVDDAKWSLDWTNGPAGHHLASGAHTNEARGGVTGGTWAGHAA